MLRFRQMKSLQKFASVQVSISNHFQSQRHHVDGQTYKALPGIPRPAETSSHPTATLFACPTSGKQPL